ncbi:MAG TPA: M3 family oligoendopeptidase [Thermomicrobiales bacterium]
MTATIEALPRWDLSAAYPALESPEFVAGWQDSLAEVADLVRYFDEVVAEEDAESPLSGESIRAVESLIGRLNALYESIDTLGAYIYGHVATDSRDDRAQALLSEFEIRCLPLSKLQPRLVDWLGSLNIDALVQRSAVARDHEYLLRTYQVSARHLMSPAEEALAAELHLSAGSAWSKLNDNLTSQIAVPFEQDGQTRHLPMSEIRNLAHHEDRDVRRHAYEAELGAWESNAVPIAAALNSIKGESATLNARRDWTDPLDLALFQNHIDRPILDAVLTAVRESFPDFRRYLRAKAHLLGTEALAWYDLFAPIGTGGHRWTYAEAADFIVAQFGTFSDRLRDLAVRAFRDDWIDAEPRPGKVDGAFCMMLRRGESRILTNFGSSYNDVATLAHELGHAYHSLALSDRTMLQHTLPSTLAETASTFCETIVQEAALARAAPAEAVAILESGLQEATQTVVDIYSRFLFEQRLFAARTARELSVDELNRLMLDAQRDTYGDGLDASLLHPYMWAVKGHYYSVGDAFYNFPYTFGLLFGLGLYARYRQGPESFTTGYDDLLASTGMADAATLASRFGIDLRSPDFWQTSLDVLRRQIDRFLDLTDGGIAVPGDGA